MDTPSLQAPQLGSNSQADAASLVRQGLAAHRAGDYGKAERSYRKALKRDPKNFAALTFLADISQLSGKHAQSIQLARKAIAINPEAPGIHLILGKSLHHMGKLEEAIDALGNAIRLKPDYADAFFILGTALRDAGEIETAIDMYEKAVSLQPRLADAHYNLGNALYDDDRHDEAIDAYRQAIMLKPEMVEAHVNLGRALLADEQNDAALAATQTALGIEPGRRSALLNKGNILRTLNRLTDAEEIYRSLIARDDQDADAYDFLGNVLQGQERLTDACAAYRRALSIKPDFEMARADLSTALLASGDLAQGWDLYEARLAAGAVTVPETFAKVARWTGQPIDGERLLVWREQGIGDDIRFASCYPDMLRRVTDEGGSCIIETDPRLVPLYRRSFPEALIRSETTRSSASGIDLQIAAGSLPGIFRRTLTDFPVREAYLKADPERITKYRTELQTLGSGLKIGFAWRSGNLSSTRLHDYTSVDQWRDLFAIPGIHFINLQYGDVNAELDEIRREHHTEIHQVAGLDLREDLEGAAALTANLDLIISAPTSVADMAGALGRPVISYGPLAHPMCLGTSALPWYPTANYIGRTWNQSMNEIFDRAIAEVRVRAGRKD